MPYFEQVALWAVHHRTTVSFALIWIITTAIAAIYLSRAGGPGAGPMSHEVQSPLTNLIVKRRACAPQFVAALTLLALFLACYIAMTLIWEDFAYYDDSAFTLGTLKGHNLSPEISPETGRFLPLAFQEFNFVRHFTDTITGYHILTIVQLGIFCAILLILDDQLEFTIRVVLLIVVLLTPSALMSFGDLLIAERDILFFLGFFALVVKHFEQTRSMAWAVAALVCAQTMIYTKETVFVLLLGFAASRLILRWRNTPALVQGYRQVVWARETRLDLCLTFSAVLFLVLYFGFVGNANMHYAASARLPRADIVLGYTRIDLLPWLLVAAVLARSYLILRRRLAPLLLWDGLAVGAVGYFLTHLYLSIFSVYYLAPVDLIAVLYLGRMMVLSWEKIRPWGRIAATLLSLVVLSQDLAVSGYALFERKNVIHAKTEIASIVKQQYRSNAGNNFRVFFPFAHPYVIMEFGAYLNHIGVPVEGTSEEASGKRDVVLAESSRMRARYPLPGNAEDGACEEWLKIMCHVISEPLPGDLIIVLPEDEASLAETSAYRIRGEPLFIYERRPWIPAWLHWIFDNLHIGAQGRYRYRALPDRWMNASVMKWK